jgi:hypothetical protein
MLRIRITVMRIRIQLFNLMRIRDPAFHFNAVADPAPHLSDGNSANTGLYILQHSNLSLQISIVSVHCHPRLCFEPLKLLNFYFNADPAFQSNADPDPVSKHNADPYGSVSATLHFTGSIFILKHKKICAYQLD